MKKNTKGALALAFALLSTSVNAQTYQWAKRLGGTAPDYGYSITADASGNVYTTGYFQGTADFDPGAATVNLTSAGNFDAFIQKMSPAGTFLWAKSFGSTAIDEGRGIKIDNSGNVYCTGSFQGTVDFDPGAGTANLTSAGGYDVFVLKLDASGNFLWAKRFGGTTDDQARSLVLDASGNVVSTGNFQGTVDFDPGAGTANLTSAGVTDSYVQKLDASGNLVWAKRFGGATTDQPFCIDMDASGNVAIVGIFTGTSDFDPGAGTTNLTSAGGQDIFINKLDASGNFLWAKRHGNADGDQSPSITIDDATGAIYTTGQFKNTVDFDPGAGTSNLTAAGLDDAYVLKLDASGNFVWVKQLGSTAFEAGLSISLDTQGNVYTTGCFQGTLDCDPGAGTANVVLSGSQNVFIQKMSSAGVYIWSCSYASGGYATPSSLYLDASNSILGTGNFTQAGDFNPESGVTTLTPSGGSSDAYVIRFSQCIAPNTGVLSGTQTVCVGSTTTFSSTVSGGTWTSSAPATATIDPVTGVITGVAAGTATMTYTVNGAAGCPNATATRTVTVNALPSVGTLSGSTSVCQGASATLSSTVSGGTWTSSNTGVATINSTSGTITGVSAGSASMTYTVTGANGCQNTGTVSVTVNALPDAGTLSGPTNVCPDESMTYNSTVSGGTWTSSNTNVATINSTSGAATAVSSGSTTMTYTVTGANGCQNTQTVSVTVNALPNVGTLNGPANICIGSSANYSSSVSGGTWTSSNTSVATINSTSGAVTAVSTGTTTLTYSVTGPTGCQNSGTTSVTVNGSSTGTDTHVTCSSFTWIDGITYTTSNNTATYTLTNAAGCDSVVTLNLTIGGATGVDVQSACESYTWVNGVTYTASNNTATYTYTNGSGCDSTVTLNLTIHEPDSTVDVRTACKFLTWIDGNLYTASNNLATYTLTNIYGCDSVVTLNLTIDPFFTVSDISTTLSGNTITANNTNATYQWLDCENNFAPINGATNQSFSPTINGSYAVEITENSCIDTSACVQITGLGFSDLINGIQLLAYPNPTNDHVTLEFGQQLEHVELILTDMVGKLISIEKFEVLTSTKVELPNPVGMYVLIVNSDQGQSKIKLEKQ